MKKIVILVLFLLLLPLSSRAADEVTFDADTTFPVGGVNLVIKDNSVADQVVVNTSSLVLTLSSGSVMNITNTDGRILINDHSLGISSSCSGSGSALNLPAPSSGTIIVTVTIGSACQASSSTPSPSGGGGGGSPAPTVPSTDTGEVTATASQGGETTLSTDENTTAGVDLPANAVSVSTDVSIASEAKAGVTTSRPIPSGKSIIGSYVYNYTAIANGATVSTFDEVVTISMTYTDDQISGLDETGLRIAYWRTSDSQWVLLSTLVFADTNTLTATTDHFTYFVILADSIDGVEADVAEETTGDTATLVDGDLIRNPNADGMAQFDIYIIKLINNKKFKRLILSPHVFESYEHFDKNGDGSPWDDVVDVSQVTMDAYTTSDLVRAVGDTKVYKLIASGDTGTKQWLNMSAAAFIDQGYDSDSIYEINATDRNAYVTGEDIL